MFDFGLWNADRGFEKKSTFRLSSIRNPQPAAPQSSDFLVTGATVRSPPGIERPALRAAVVHLSRKQVGDDRAQDEDAAEDGDAQKSISQPLYFSPRLRR